MLYYKKWNNFEFENVPITTEDIKRILSECKVINIKAKEELPKGKVIFVGVGNEKYDCMALYDLEYTNHMKYTYGGYVNEGHSRWWTMNYNYSDLYDKTKMYVVNNMDDGEKLAVFLNFTGGLNNINKTISQKHDEIRKLQDDIDYLKEINLFLSK